MHSITLLIELEKWPQKPTLRPILGGSKQRTEDYLSNCHIFHAAKNGGNISSIVMKCRAD